MPPHRQLPPKIVFRKLSEADDIKAYLNTFERQVTSADFEQQHLAFKLAPYLTGKVQQTYPALNSNDGYDYTSTKRQSSTGTISLWRATAWNISEQLPRNLENLTKSWWQGWDIWQGNG